MPQHGVAGGVQELAHSLYAFSTGDVLPAPGSLGTHGGQQGVCGCWSPLELSPAGCQAWGTRRAVCGSTSTPAHVPTRASSSWHTGSVFLAAQPSPIWYLSPSRNPSCCGGDAGFQGGTQVPLLTLQCGSHCASTGEEVVLRDQEGGVEEGTPPQNARGCQEVSLGALEHLGWLRALGATPLEHLCSKQCPSPKLAAMRAAASGRGHIIPPTLVLPSGCQFPPFPKSWVPQSRRSPERPWVAWATAARH